MNKVIYCFVTIVLLLFTSCEYRAVQDNGRIHKLVTPSGKEYFVTNIGYDITCTTSNGPYGEYLGNIEFDNGVEMSIYTINNYPDDSMLIVKPQGLMDYCYVVAEEGFDYSTLLDFENIEGIFFVSSIESQEWLFDYDLDVEYLKDKAVCNSLELPGIIDEIRKYKTYFNDESLKLIDYPNWLGDCYTKFKNTGDLRFRSSVYANEDYSIIRCFATDYKSDEQLVFDIPIEAFPTEIAEMLLSHVE